MYVNQFNDGGKAILSNNPSSNIEFVLRPGQTISISSHVEQKVDEDVSNLLKLAFADVWYGVGQAKQTRDQFLQAIYDRGLEIKLRGS